LLASIIFCTCHKISCKVKISSAKISKFLKEIAQKEQGQDVPLTFNKTYIKIAIILVARPETESLGVERFIKRIQEKIKQRVNVIYVFARGRNIKLAKEIFKKCSEMPDFRLDFYDI